ncbi:DEAD/DEAH box helicase [Priestia aryabhattai]|uniref:DEAD/DEAH box helicase n=1 Tax=Priestia aryabhattai TaxID=412384 RepID=UPI0039A21F80
MRIALKGFQEHAVEEMIKELSNAKREVREGSLQSVVLSSPTGSGKTVITAALMETILEGTDEIPAERDAIFLWFSDQPELNEQSRKKIVSCSDRFRENDITIVGPDFDQETFDGGKLYFINTQKLGRDKLLTTKGDKRNYTIWETIQNSSKQYKDKFYLIIDEAHRGMNRTSRDESFSRTIVQKLILGDPEVGVQPIGMIIGISATPERFLRLLQGTQQHQQSRRIPRIIEIDPEEARTSGLLKDKIVLFHPTENHPSDWTLLSAATRQLFMVREEWNQYTRLQNIEEINPAMVIQVEDRSDTSISKTNLELVVKTIEDEIGPIRDGEIAHCFEEDIDIPVGSRRIRKIEPSRIQDEKEIKFILFKMSLTTGWDCPRAEVMMSFRKAQDHTLIAQLIGRMVRTPLARRIEGQELLNSVSLYLPHYDSQGLKSVVEHLKNDPDIVPPTDVETGNSQVILNRKKDSEFIFKALDELPHYRVENSRKVSNVRRLMKLSRLLTSFHQIDSEALDSTKKLIVRTIFNEKEKLRISDVDFERKVNEADEIIVNPITVEQGIWRELVGDPIKIKLTDTNISELFNRCGKRLGEGLHMEYWSNYYDKTNPNRPKLELFITLERKEVFERLEEVCKNRLNELFDKHRITIRSLPSSEQEKYNTIRELSRIPEAIEFIAPSQILIYGDITTSDYELYDNHLYTNEDGKFPTNLNGWEKLTIETEVQREDFVGWLRNYDRKTWSFSIPYEDSGKIKPMYPDFLVVRELGDNYIVDILEPHREDLDDNWKKASGLAKFAQKHWNSFGRIELIRKRGKQLKRLNLNDDIVRSRVIGVTSNDHLDTFFDALSI